VESEAILFRVLPTEHSARTSWRVRSSAATFNRKKLQEQVRSMKCIKSFMGMLRSLEVVVGGRRLELELVLRSKHRLVSGRCSNRRGIRVNFRLGEGRR